MLRRWSIVLVTLTLSAATALVASGTAAAGTGMATANTPTASHVSVDPGGLPHLVGHESGAAGILHQAQSTNWSGYADSSGTFTSVSASWTQPRGTCGRSGQFAAFWVGIDGFNSGTVEQTGSEVDCIGRTAQYAAWFEMFPGPSQNYSNPVAPGDHFTATVKYLGGQNFSLFIADTTQGWSHTTNASLGQAPALSSAEVIVEAPCCTSSGGVLSLADFGTVSLTGPTANGEAIGTSALSPTEITMIDSQGRDKDSCSGLTSGENFTCTWLRST
ncbi:MAG TPA: G1 family glutamic endopeptidase [Streptosporangiaceae bacterium]|nr:G1 family glutamic endopeptidase [Streptosporangiaceae bacterium]